MGEGVAVCLTMSTVAALAILLVSILCNRLLGMVPTWQDIQERDPVSFEACEATFSMAKASLNKTLFGLGSLDFRERDKR